MFVIRLNNGSEVHETEGDRLSFNHDTGVITVSHIEGFEQTTTHYSPTAWEMVTHRVKDVAIRRSGISVAR